MQLQITTSQTHQAENLLVFMFQNENLSQNLTHFLQQYNLNADRLLQDFKAETKEIEVFYTNKAKIYLLGVGKNPQLKDWVKISRSFFYNQRFKLQRSLWIDAQNLLPNHMEGLLNGLFLSQYQTQMFKTESKKDTTFSQTNPNIELTVLPQYVETVQKTLQYTRHLAEVQKQMMDLVNLPSNKKTPQTLVDWATQSAQKYGYQLTVLDKEALKTQKLEALLAVGQGSHHPPYLIVMEYKPKNPVRKIGFVGKGITFDTGGISIKDSNNMHYMKSDMGGAASVFGIVELVVRMELPYHIIGVVPTAENSVDALSFKPSDVIGSYLGKSIEVIDTDAEGRLILADGLAYLNKNYQPDILIDLATLTGNCIAALGYEAAGLFTNNDELAEKLLKAGDSSGERLWRLPLWDSYKDEIISDIADLRNHNGKSFAGAITAAKFLEVFTENHPHYAHIDIAGMAFGDSEFAKAKTATAFGIKLLYQFLENL